MRFGVANKYLVFTALISKCALLCRIGISNEMEAQMQIHVRQGVREVREVRGQKDYAMSEVIKLPVNAEQHARAETARKQELFEWGDGVLVKLGYTTRINFAQTVQELNQIIFNPNSVEVMMAIRDALHPATGGPRVEFFVGMNGASLKRLLASRFEETIKNRREALSRDLFGLKPGPHWSDDLVTGGNGTIRPILANFELILRKSQNGKGFWPTTSLLTGWSFANLHLLKSKADTWTDDAETQTRIFFQRHYDLTAGLGDLGRAIQSVARHSAFHPVRDHLNALEWEAEAASRDMAANLLPCL